MRNKFNEQLDFLNREMISMGALCEDAIAMSANAILTGDISLAKKVIEIKADFNENERTIESLCLKLLMQQQPVARDLRQISSALKMITDIKRIGDQAADIAEIITMDNIRTTDDTSLIGDMACATIKMVTESVEAFVKQDIILAKSVIDYDDVVDDLFNKVKDMLIALIGKIPYKGEYVIDLLMISKYLERIGDHAVNIAEWVVFSVTGIHKGEIKK